MDSNITLTRFSNALAWTAYLAAAALVMTAAIPTTLGQDGDPLDVLLVTAHPDDEAMFAGAVYKITHELGGNVDLAVVTDGSGGFRYAHLAEPIYHLDLTDEEVARQHLPAIRKQELMAGGEIIGIRDYIFIDQLDHGYTENVDTVLQHVWDADDVRERLREAMSQVDYDFIFAHLPIENFHAHHKAATILALEVAREMPPDRRPIVLGSFVGSPSEPDAYPSGFSELPGYPITRVLADTPPFVFDRTQAVDETGRLNYHIVVNWLIAEHRTQGTMQLLMNRGDIERFWFFAMNDPAGIDRTRELFERLAQ